MANSRLFLGNKETKEYIFVEKGWGVYWNGGWFNSVEVQAFIMYGDTCGDETDLIFFTEFCDCYSDFMENGERFDYTEWLDENGQLIIME
jgi:hypothetical protein